ncbi:MAG: hypothetical protein LQ340_002355 [Diploschistes diacapsis]|nr:MAG: hypothetical protein LQ340_002355 [Diploschistes diacapsis]
MGLLPKLIGEIEIRERRPRYDGEPRHKRLNFIRSKTTTESDDWRLVYPQPQVSCYRHPWEHPLWSSLSYHQQRGLLARNGYPQPPFQPFEHHDHDQDDHGDIPITPLQVREAGHEGQSLKDAEEPPPGPDDESDGGTAYKVIRPKEKYHTKHKPQPSGNTIFGSDSEDDCRSHRRSAGSITTVSSEGSSVSRRRHCRKGHVGW